MRQLIILAALAASMASPLAAQSIDSGLAPAPQGLSGQSLKDGVVSDSSKKPGNTISPTARPERPRIFDTVTIGGSSKVTGVATLNAAAGANNQQANVGLIASGDTAAAMANIFQTNHSQVEAGNQDARASLAAGTFAGSNGWIAVNGAAGSDNQQANLAIMALGGEGMVVSDSTLASTRASQQPMGENGATVDAPSRSVAVGQGAFKDSSGIVQLSLVGGDRNTTANTFALLVAGSAGLE